MVLCQASNAALQILRYNSIFHHEGEKELFRISICFRVFHTSGARGVKNTKTNRDPKKRLTPSGEQIITVWRLEISQHCELYRKCLLLYELPSVV
jgi:hypothetical protein